MLIHCPRCGFSQPKDEYCASCGVNIETYVPRKANSLEKIFSSTLVQVLAVLIIALGASYFVLRDQNSTTAQVTRRKNIQQSMATSNSSLSARNIRPEIMNQSPPLESETTDVSVELQNEEQRNRLAGAGEPNASRAAVSANSPKASAAARGQKAPAVIIKVSYYEVSRTVLSYWIRSTQATPDNESAFNAGLINRKIFDDQIRYASLKTESTQALINAKTNFQSQANKDGQLIGLNSEIVMSSLNSGSITITKTTAQGSESIRTFMNISPNSIFFIHWKSDLAGLENEPILLDVPPFQIFKSKQFMGTYGTTELVMIIELLN